MAQSNAIATGQVSVTAAAAVLVPARADRKKVTIVNGAAAAVNLGPSTVTTANGILLAGIIGATLVFETAAAIYAVSGGATPVSYLEEFA